jgi:hypothetical protein
LTKLAKLAGTICYTCAAVITLLSLIFIIPGGLLILAAVFGAAIGDGITSGEVVDTDEEY